MSTLHVAHEKKDKMNKTNAVQNTDPATVYLFAEWLSKYDTVADAAKSFNVGGISRGAQDRIVQGIV